MNMDECISSSMKNRCMVIDKFHQLWIKNELLWMNFINKP
jgi:hypothetical protein